jgi:DNA-binding MarR family transcriptional regulator
MTLSPTRPVRSRARGAPGLASLDLVRTLVDRLSSSARAVERRTGVTNAQLFLLQQVAADSALSVNDLAARARTQQSTVSTVVSRLERAGLVAKARAAGDARRAVITVTAAGRRLLRNAPAPPTATLMDALAKLNAAEARSLSAGLAALVRHLGPAPRKPVLLFEDHRPPNSR